MTAIAAALKDALATKSEKPAEFIEQLERYKAFKQKMNEAGIEYGDKYEVPLMARLRFASN